MNKFVAFFKALNRAQKAVRRFVASDVIRAESKAHAAAMAMIAPDFATTLANAGQIGQTRKEQTVQKVKEMESALAAAKQDDKSADAYIEAYKLLSK